MFFSDRFSLSKRRKTPQGFLEAGDSRIAKVGILRYRAHELGLTDRDPNAEVILYRSPEELFRPETIESFKSVPVTNGHPPKLLTAENAKKFTVGMMKDDIRQGGSEFMEGTPVIFDGDAIDDVENGKNQMSNGYEADVEFTPGTDPVTGIEYHGRQTNIRGNHVAIVEIARCGSNCKISDEQTKNEVKSMETVKVMFDGVEIEMTKQGSQALAKVQEELKTAKSENTKVLNDSASAVESANSASQAKIDALQAELDDANTKIMDEAAIEAYVTERQELLDSAEKITGEAYDGKGKTTAEIKKDVVATVRKIDVADAKLTDNYVDASFDILMENVANGSNNNKALKDHASTKVVATDSSKTPSQIAREKKMEEDRNAHKGETR